MRLHRLTVTAFGPFAGTERVDFDELNDAGLFLLTGPTGAGKTQRPRRRLLRALRRRCPGARGVKTLQSQHAAGRAPSPRSCSTSACGDRRFVVRRIPGVGAAQAARRRASPREKASAVAARDHRTASEHLLSVAGRRGRACWSPT